MAYDPSDLRLPPWLLRLLDTLIRIEIPLTPAWRIGVTRPGVLLVGVLTGLWLAAFYSGNNLLYLCGAMLSALALTSIWQGVRLLKTVPPLAAAFPSSTEAGESYVLRAPLQHTVLSIGMVDVLWSGDDVDLPLQLRLEQEPLLTGRLRAEKRSLIHLHRQRLTTEAPLGLWRISRFRDEPRAWAVLPKAVVWAEAYSGGAQHTKYFEGDELRDLRAYVPGDALSRIHWRKAALEVNQWSVKQFEQHEHTGEARRLRVDLRLPQSAAEGSFEVLLGRAWYWVEAHLRGGEKRLEIVLGQQQFELTSVEQRSAFFMALAGASPQTLPPAGQNGLLLSLVEGP
ncbi:MAG TPA: DUF58 domain-containing protein [Mariprofundaceae bacterium]|nr:DUF58 domain-containing protein [Mariprofundaceae bacterium]